MWSLAGKHHRSKVFSFSTEFAIRVAMKYMLICAAVFLPSLFAIPIDTGSADGPSVEDTKFLQVYLDRFFPTYHKGGHSLQERLREMQEFFHLAVTGRMDKDTLNVMKKPRCGVSDVLEEQKAPTRIWNKQFLTYRINNYTPDLPRRTIDEAIAKAFRVWSDVTPLRFQKVFRPADIEISFAHGEHGDYNPFDRQGGVLAHAFFPGHGIGGDTHFDEAEKWSEHNRQVNLFLVAAHEFGHALGLSHSNVVGSLMYPTYSYSNPQSYRLPSNDRQRIQRFYGSRK